MTKVSQKQRIAQKLVDSEVSGVIGHLNSGTTIPASKIYHDEEYLRFLHLPLM